VPDDLDAYAMMRPAASRDKQFFWDRVNSHELRIKGRRLPFVIALVELEEGVRMLGEVGNFDPATDPELTAIGIDERDHSSPAGRAPLQNGDSSSAHVNKIGRNELRRHGLRCLL
jgi:hypothetical protein